MDLGIVVDKKNDQKQHVFIPSLRWVQNDFLDFGFKGHGFHVGNLRLMIFIFQNSEKVM